MAKDMNDLVNDLLETSRELRDFMNNDAPRIAGTEAVNHASENFETESFEGDKWKQRASGTPRNSRPVLTDRSNLKDSIRYQANGLSVDVGVDGDKVPYAEIHNEGGAIRVSPEMRKYFWAKYYETGAKFYKWLALTKKSFIEIPQRKYLEYTPAVKERISTAFKPHFKRIFEK